MSIGPAIRRIADHVSANGHTPTDSEFLTRFIMTKNAAAFAILADRHGPAV